MEILWHMDLSMLHTANTHFKIVFCKEASMSFMKWGLDTSVKILCFNVRIKYWAVPIVHTKCCPLKHRLISYVISHITLPKLYALVENQAMDQENLR